ncbi:hypothetical protein [Tenacibaculum sp. 190524A02b]|uniref:hypothetical protein n=1 Tax=Tenacibaculum vairaonense TaxID=3137860 RepID=UPI0032B21188
MKIINKVKYYTCIMCGILIVLCTNLYGQKKVEFSGQLSGLINYSPNNERDVFLGARYIPELQFNNKLDSVSDLDIEASLNASSNLLFKPFYKSVTTNEINPYRFWIRYSRRKFEARLGLQKIDFGSASIIRPLQWFNQIDARDPLQLTNGVYGALFKYYFKNNASIWAWVLYGNDKRRGFDLFVSEKYQPEYGLRVQLPIAKGEIALSYHSRNVSVNTIEKSLTESIPEYRFGVDVKWDLIVGLWIEASHVKLQKNIGVLTNQSLINLGTSYTFGIGNGLNANVEHMVNTLEEESFTFQNNNHFTAITLQYPFGFFDSINLVSYYAWKDNSMVVSLNYQHQFEAVTGYLMGYYNPTNTINLPDNQFINAFSGFGIRLMAVFNH